MTVEDTTKAMRRIRNENYKLGIMKTRIAQFWHAKTCQNCNEVGRFVAMGRTPQEVMQNLADALQERLHDTTKH